MSSEPGKLGMRESNDLEHADDAVHIFANRADLTSNISRNTPLLAAGATSSQSTNIRRQSNRPGSIQIPPQLPNLSLQSPNTVPPQRQSKILMPSIHSFQYRSRRLIRVAFHRISKRRDVARVGDHLVNRGTTIGVAEAVTAVVLGGGDDPGGERGAEGAGLYDQYLYTECLKFVGEGFVDGFDGEFAGGVGCSAWSGDESKQYWGFIRQIKVSSVRQRDVGPDGRLYRETYPAPLLIRTILPDPLARMLGRIARTVRSGP